MEHDIISIVHCACCKYAEPFPTDPRVLICANPKWVPTGDGRRNHFTTEWKSTDCFGWTLESPYTD